MRKNDARAVRKRNCYDILSNVMCDIHLCNLSSEAQAFLSNEKEIVQ